MEDNAVKRWLGRANAHMREKADREKFVPAEDSLKLDRHHGIVKNFLRLANKTLIGLNKHHINRWEWAAGLMGMGLGWAFGQTDDFVVQVRNTHQGVIKSALIHHILRSQTIKDKLNESLLDNVYTNPDIQYTLHQLLLTNAIRPLQQDLQKLTRQAVIMLLHSPTIRQQFITLAAEQIVANTSAIGAAGLQFLGSTTMDGIVGSALSSLLRGEMFSELLASEFGGQFNGNLMKDSNKQNLYMIVREHFINW